MRRGTGNLGDFQGVGEPVAEVVGKARGEDLRLVEQTAESTGVDDAITVSAKGIAIGMGGLGIASPARGLHRKTQMAEHAGHVGCGSYFLTGAAGGVMPPGNVSNMACA